ncbi:MAG: helix-turn-helix domain-containing protein [Phaeospirillum sp.]|nr:helix-turn-helix domain-containing protein [Phaeospirillum sp.]
MTPELLSLNATCAYTGLSISTIKRRIEGGEIPALKVGRKVVIRRTDVDAWLSALPARESRHVAA